MQKTQEAFEQKERFRLMTGMHKKLPVFSQPWWLDVVAGTNNWNVIISQGQGRVDGVLPYAIRKTIAGNALIMPKLTQTLGPWIDIPKDAKQYRKLSLQKKVMYNLLEQLPKFSIYRQNWSPEIQNWQPFYWKGFSQTTRYTYVIPTAITKEEAWSRIEQKTRNQIRRAKDKHGVVISRENVNDIGAIWRLIEDTFGRQSLKVPYSKDLFLNLHKVASEHNSGQNIVAYVGPNPVAAGFFVWDERKMYYLISGSDKNNRETHAMSLVLWTAIKLAVQKKLAFDFEGTMLENVEPHFRSFGAQQTPFFTVCKYVSKIARTRLALSLLTKGWC